jgi:hypothetical protein
MLQAIYPTKKALKSAIGESLMYRETTLFNTEYMANGYNVMSNVARSWYAEVWLINGLIVKVK